MARKIERAGEYWGEHHDLPRVAASGIEDLLKGPSIHAGLLHFAEEADPSKPQGIAPEDLTRIKAAPGLREINQTLFNEGGSSPDGSPERWPGQLPGDQLLGVGDQFKDQLINKLPVAKPPAKPKPKAAPKPTPPVA